MTSTRSPQPTSTTTTSLPRRLLPAAPLRRTTIRGELFRTTNELTLSATNEGYPWARHRHACSHWLTERSGWCRNGLRRRRAGRHDRSTSDDTTEPITEDLTTYDEAGRVETTESLRRCHRRYGSGSTNSPRSSVPAPSSIRRRPTTTRPAVSISGGFIPE
jgi:hypothetical protein